jgi:hypothetical protein
MRSFAALRKHLLPVLILALALIVGCRGCRERDDSFPQADEVPIAPSVTAIYPDNGDIDIPLNSKISATFNSAMVATEIGTATFTLSQTGGAAIAGTVTYVGLIALFLPAADLAANTSYSATVNAGIRSVAGSTLAENFTWTFTTGAVLDNTAPSVVSTNPISGAIGVPVNTIVTVPFDEVMDPLTINGTTFFLTEAPLASIRANDVSLLMSVPGGFVSGTVSYLGRTAYFKPSSPLKLGTTYTAVITTGAKDLAGNALAENYVWSFTGVVADTTAPTVASTDPAANKTDVAINTKIAVTFSEMMSSATLTNASFKIEGVSGTVTYDPLTKIAIFKPTTSLTAGKLYTATITTAAQDLAGNAITENYIWSFTTGATADTTPPAVVSTIPTADGSNVIPDQKISATFSEGMDSSTINGTTFAVKGPGGAAVSGTVTYAGTSATFITTGFLANSTLYTATIGSGAKDLAGNAMAAAKTWSFTTGAAAPTVTSTDPLNGSVNVATNKSISATFSGTMDPATINGTTFTLQGPGGAAIAGAVSYAGTTATFKPAAVLANSTLYTATVTTGAKDLSGKAIVAAKTWSFTTGALADIIAPTVTSTSPADGEIDVPTNKSVTAVFSENMDFATITDTTFTLTAPGGATVGGTVAYVGTTATFKPTNLLGNSGIYTATISTGAKDTAGNTMAAIKTWSFTTGALADTIAPTITSVEPVNAATAVATNRIITANFSEYMDSPTITNTTFTVRKLGGALIDGAVTYAGTTATFKPAILLANSTTYVANITVGVKDQAGNAMATARTWSFVTGAAPDTVAPTLASTDPVNSATGVVTSKSISASFSESMDSLTLNNTTFTVRKFGGAFIEGIVTYDTTSRTATFRPASPLANSTNYVVEITTAVEDLAGNTMAAAKTWSFTTGALADIIAPTVTSTIPSDGETDVATNKSVAAVFSENMDAATISNTTFTLTAPGGAAVGGTVTYVGTTATFKPIVLLSNSGMFTATISSGVKDTAGNSMATVKTWSFTTGAAPDIVAPTVATVDPVDGATAVATNKIITANFSEDMDSATLTNTTFTLRELGGALIAGTVTHTSTTAAFKPAILLKNSTTYVANISVGVKDLAGNAMASARTWSFVTGAAPDIVAPTVTSTDPFNTAVDVATNKSITASFSESMNSATITTANFTVRKLDGAFIDGTVTYDSTAKAATFKPASSLANSTTYVANLTTAVEDLAGNTIAVAKTWRFTTIAAPDLVAPTVTSTSPADGEIDVPTNKSVAAVFSENIDSATITNTTFTLTDPDGASVGGAVTYVGTTATFKPAAVLGNSKVYTARITTGVKDSAGNAMAMEKTWSFTTGAAPDIIAPTVTTVDPVDGATAVATNKIITANFSEDMDSATLTNTTFTLRELGGALIAGTVTHTSTTAAFKPAILLKNSTTYVANITVGVKDLAGNAMASAKTWSFVTGAAPDIVAPTVTSTDPFNTAVDLAVSKSITASFSESMNSATITTANFTLRKFGGALIDGTVTYDSTAKAATFKPASSLAYSTTYVAEINTAVEDLAGNELGVVKSWSFTTGAAPDTTAPQVTSVYPVNGAKDIGCKEAITATFDEEMDSATIFQTTPKVTVTLTGPGLTPVAGVVTYVDKIAKFTPGSDLADNTLFTATIDTQAKDLAGNALASSKVWSFTTGQSEPVLGRSSSFALMASTAISGVAGSEINGDVGISPNGRGSVTLIEAEINGTIYSAADQEILDAIADLKIAYDTAKAKATNVETLATKDLGGKTFYPGLYKTGDSFDITSGDLTLDARGNANSVFIFQMPTTLTVAVGRKVILINNAKASNIYWQVGSSATLNTTTVFKGNIMANVSITVNGGSNVEGRLLAAAGTDGSGAVVFNTSIINIPAP